MALTFLIAFMAKPCYILKIDIFEVYLTAITHGWKWLSL